MLARRLVLRVGGVCVALVAGGCVVSFDGYELASSDAGVGGVSGSGTGGTAAGGVGGGSGGSLGGSGGASGGTAGNGGVGASGGSAGAGGGNAGMGGASGSAGSTGGNGGSSGATSCPQVAGISPMKKLLKADGGEYCIDVTEVTNEHYSNFLASPPDPTNQPQGCSGNGFAVPDTFECGYDAINKPNQPVRCVDWCDAHAFCKKYGKRLCGAQSGGPTPITALTDAAQSEWFRACSAGGTQAYVFGSNYSLAFYNTCNGLENGSGVVNVGSMGSCQPPGAFSGVFDLNGNLREWEDSCNTLNQCASRGGGHDDTGDPGSGERMRCDSAVMVSRTAQSEYRGFRCCADPS